MPSMQRVMAVGPSGAGKSTLARVIGAALDLPDVHLGREYWQPCWVEPDKSWWLRRLDELTAVERWVIDKNYLHGTELRLQRAAAIVCLDSPRHVYFRRALLRNVMDYGRVRPDMAPGCRDNLDLGFLTDWVWNYPGHSRPRILATLEQLSGNKPVLISRSVSDIRAFEAGLPVSLRGQALAKG